ncbi:calmodulin-regulated spectrin-associated protein 1-B isoform X6 [Acipenser ruthenus]|uniref:calmodulin-regulated spectrin-associated protein 1-B isoform X6 n=1 Tax=Acipenser ruthenus TaxID=7906 RepID=UPI002741FDF5|nr:calmodulin-regulated spectrin-associated protein 1-B isoform X6 [Acipenser ruthenus]
MDVDVCAGGDSTRRKMDTIGDGALEVVPLELYDSSRAKIDANLRWLFAKAYGIDNIPEDLRDPFYTDQYEQEHIKPPVIKLLLSSELYCRVCSLILKGDQVAALQGHQSVIQALSRKGIYVMDSDDTPVSESDLNCAPIKMSAHMPMIDALMMAYTVEMISIEKVVASVKRFSTFSASKELPFDLEDAMVFWINKVNLKMREITEKELKLKQQLLESPSHQKSPSKWYWKLVPVRYRRDQLSSRQLPYFPLLEDLVKDVCDGAALLAVIHYYCPELMKLDDICLKEVTSIADSLYNIQLLKEFANEYLNKGFYLTTEDMLYAPLGLKHNVMVFIAELFWWFEIVKPDFVQPRDFQEIKDARAMQQSKSTRPPVPISNATKRSFMVSPAGMASPAETPLPPPIQSSPEVSSRYYLHPEESDLLKGSPAYSLSHPLLPLRQKQQKSLQGEDSPGLRHRSNSLTQDDGQPRGSVVAWPEKKQRPVSQPTPYALHYATDSDIDIASGDNVSLARSISKDSLASNVINLTPKHQPQTGLRKVNGQGLLRNVSIEDEEEEELIAIIRSEERINNRLPYQGDLELQSISSRATTARSPRVQDESSSQPSSFFLEPLMPAALKPAKEKSVNVNKEQESGEGRHKGAASKRLVDGNLPSTRTKVMNSADPDLNRTFTPISSSDFTNITDSTLTESVQLPMESAFGPFRPLATSSVDPAPGEQSGGFFLHCSESEEKATESIGSGSPLCMPESTWEVRQDSDSEVLDMDEVDQDLEVANEIRPVRRKYFGEEESAKLQEDMKVKEHEDKDGGSGCSSPCLSTISQASSVSMASGSIKMTSFAERKLQRINSHEAKSSTSSSQKTTPDGSECGPVPLTTWRQKRDQSPTRQSKDNVHVLASELVQLHMQLEEKRRAIETQKKKMEALSARQRLKLGKAAFLHVVKKGKTESIPQPLKPDYLSKEDPKVNGESFILSAQQSRAEEVSSNNSLHHPQEVPKEKDMQESRSTVKWARESPTPPTVLDTDNKLNSTILLDDSGSEIDVNECNRSIDMLNNAISTIQQQMMQLSLQQDLLMKQNVQSPTTTSPNGKSNPPEQKIRPAVHFVEPLSPTGNGTVRKPPRFGLGRSPRSKPTDLKLSKEKQQSAPRIITPTQSIETLPHLRPFPGNRTAKAEPEDASPISGIPVESRSGTLEKGSPRSSSSFRLHEEANQRTFVLSTSKDTNNVSEQEYNECQANHLKEAELNSSDGSGKENIPFEESSKSKTQLIEVDLSDLKAPTEEGNFEIQDTSADTLGEGDQKSVLGFFFKDEQKAEDELAKKRAAFLLKQQRKAEEARLRKHLLEAEIEQKREEARRKAEEDRIRKEEEKARRELIKQEYLRRKQQEIIEEQGQGKLKTKPKKQRPKSVHREETYSDTPSKCSSTPDNLSSAQSGSSLSLASAATTEAESVHSGGAASQRGESVESFPGLSRNASRNTERDWENASTASSIASVAEYTGPKLFKEPSAKSNKTIIHNAISHCCLAGKVNEPHKNSILEVIEKCESNHLMILFRDAGCMFRSLYSYFPDTEEIHKVTGTGPKSISKKMIDKLYKYSSDRKQFNVIPAKTVSVSVDALTIHNHLWQVKRPSVPKKSGK